MKFFKDYEKLAEAEILNEALDSPQEFYLTDDTSVPDKVCAAFDLDDDKYVAIFSKTNFDGIYSVKFGYVPNKNVKLWKFRKPSHVRRSISTLIKIFETVAIMLGPKMKAAIIETPNTTNTAKFNSLMQRILKKTYLNSIRFVPVAPYSGDDKKLAHRSNYVFLIRKPHTPQSVFSSKHFRKYTFDPYEDGVPVDAIAPMKDKKAVILRVSLTPNGKFFQATDYSLKVDMDNPILNDLMNATPIKKDDPGSSGKTGQKKNPDFVPPTSMKMEGLIKVENIPSYAKAQDTLSEPNYIHYLLRKDNPQYEKNVNFKDFVKSLNKELDIQGHKGEEPKFSYENTINHVEINGIVNMLADFITIEMKYGNKEVINYFNNYLHPDITGEKGIDAKDLRGSLLHFNHDIEKVAATKPHDMNIKFFFKYGSRKFEKLCFYVGALLMYNYEEYLPISPLFAGGSAAGMYNNVVSEINFDPKTEYDDILMNPTKVDLHASDARQMLTQVVKDKYGNDKEIEVYRYNNHGHAREILKKYERQMLNNEKFTYAKDYTSNNFKYFNRPLRGMYKGEITRLDYDALEYQQYIHEGSIEGLWKMFDEMPPLEESLWVFRNATMVRDDIYWDIDKPLIDAGFVSTSLQPSRFYDVEPYSESSKPNTGMAIYIPKGSKVIPILNHSNYETENEVILPAGSVFKVIGVKQASQYGQFLKMVYTGNVQDDLMKNFYEQIEKIPELQSAQAKQKMQNESTLFDRSTFISERVKMFSENVDKKINGQKDDQTVADREEKFQDISSSEDMSEIRRKIKSGKYKIKKS